MKTEDIYRKMRMKSIDENEKRLTIPGICGSSWDLPDGVYQVGIDRAVKGSKDYSCRVWMKTTSTGEMVIVAEEYY